MKADNFSLTEKYSQEGIESFAFVLAVIACVFMSAAFAIRSSKVSQNPCRIQLESRLNPNHAPIVSLVRLPGIGMSRAGAIAAYREQFRAKNDSQPIFKKPQDLQLVKGIGPKTSQKISQWLKFE